MVVYPLSGPVPIGAGAFVGAHAIPYGSFPARRIQVIPGGAFQLRHHMYLFATILLFLRIVTLMLRNYQA